MRNLRENSIKYREGNTLLVPYIDFTLPHHSNVGVLFGHIVLGPTENSNLSMNSLANYLTRMQSSPLHGIENSLIPFRSR
jgi:hypothetical protein